MFAAYILCVIFCRVTFGVPVKFEKPEISNTRINPTSIKVKRIDAASKFLPTFQVQNVGSL